MAAMSDALAERVRARMASQVVAARDSPIEYIRSCARVEGNKPAQVTAVHREWQDALSSHPRVLLFAPVGHGKSNQVTRWRTEWELGKNHNLRVGLVSNTDALPQKILGAIKQDIEKNAWLKKVFPSLRPSFGHDRSWGDSIKIDRTDITADPTIQTFGLFGKILGSRLDLIVIDDICNLENTLTKHSRGKVHEWLTGEVFSRLPPHGGRIWVLGHVWHIDDALHRISRSRDFVTKRYSARVPNEDGSWRPLIPEMWTPEALEQMAEHLGPVYSKMMLDNELADAAAGRIQRDWFTGCLQRGSGLTMVDHWNTADAPTYTGVDLGVSGKRDKSAFFTVAVLPDGSRRLLNIRAGHWKGPDLVRQIDDVHRRYGSIIHVENNAAQDFIVQFANELISVPVRGHHTGVNKHSIEFGVESLGTEVSRGKWIIPCDDALIPSRETAEWITEAVSYHRETHMGDTLSASWICREAIRKSPSGQAYADQFAVDSLTR